jgi:hypothetical protein
MRLVLVRLMPLWARAPWVPLILLAGLVLVVRPGLPVRPGLRPA